MHRKRDARCAPGTPAALPRRNPSASKAPPAGASCRTAGGRASDQTTPLVPSQREAERLRKPLVLTGRARLDGGREADCWGRAGRVGSAGRWRGMRMRRLAKTPCARSSRSESILHRAGGRGRGSRPVSPGSGSRMRPWSRGPGRLRVTAPPFDIKARIQALWTAYSPEHTRHSLDKKQGMMYAFAEDALITRQFSSPLGSSSPVEKRFPAIPSSTKGENRVIFSIHTKKLKILVR